MADVFSKEKRSELMSRIRGRNNLGTEIALVRLFRRNGITGWRRHLHLPGRPDFTFSGSKLTVFVDGCFWHGCTICSRNLKPSTNRQFWSEKIVTNRRRDRRANRKLREAGWHVLRIWEHHLKERPTSCVAKISRRIT